MRSILTVLALLSAGCQPALVAPPLPASAAKEAHPQRKYDDELSRRNSEIQGEIHWFPKLYEGPRRRASVVNGAISFAESCVSDSLILDLARDVWEYEYQKLDRLYEAHEPSSSILAQTKVVNDLYKTLIAGFTIVKKIRRLESEAEMAKGEHDRREWRQTHLSQDQATDLEKELAEQFEIKYQKGAKHAQEQIHVLLAEYKEWYAVAKPLEENFTRRRIADLKKENAQAGSLQLRDKIEGSHPTSVDTKLWFPASN